MDLTVTVRDILEVMEAIAPASLAEPWDNVGLQVGRDDWPVQKIRVVLDATDELVCAACSEQINLLITHHPLIFHPLKRIDLTTYTGKILYTAIQNKIAIFCAHTNLDSTPGGVNDILAEKLGLKDTRVLKTSEQKGANFKDMRSGLGRIGHVGRDVTLRRFAEQTKEKLGLDRIKVAGDPALRIKRAVVCSGSGRGLIGEFLVSDAEGYVSGDLGYHDGRRVEAEGRGLIDVGHFASEQLIVDGLTARLRETLAARGYPVEVSISDGERDCFYYI